MMPVATKNTATKNTANLDVAAARAWLALHLGEVDDVDDAVLDRAVAILRSAQGDRKGGAS